MPVLGRSRAPPRKDDDTRIQLHRLPRRSRATRRGSEHPLFRFHTFLGRYSAAPRWHEEPPLPVRHLPREVPSTCPRGAKSLSHRSGDPLREALPPSFRGTGILSKWFDTIPEMVLDHLRNASEPFSKWFAPFPEYHGTIFEMPGDHFRNGSRPFSKWFPTILEMLAAISEMVSDHSREAGNTSSQAADTCT
jgi:hypothetical protein